jgi:hypothetical protein
MKLKNVAAGTRAVKRIPLPLVNRPTGFAPEVPELLAQVASDNALAAAAGEPAIPASVDVGVRVMTGSELATVYEKAEEFARSKGVSSSNIDGNPIYNLGLSVYTCAVACVDPDSDVRNPEPFFGERGDVESAALELLESPHISRDSIEYLAKCQQAWQDLCSPDALRVSMKGLVDAVAKIGSSDDEEAFETFLALRPGTQWVCARFMAKQLLILQTLKSPATSTSSGTSSTGSSADSPDPTKSSSAPTTSLGAEKSGGET